MPLINEQEWQALPEAVQQTVYDFFLFMQQRYAQTDEQKQEGLDDA